ncbi:MAG: hypothetical protein OD815_001751 [Candidatus Alkanophagales archaeon MCA70_species_2]|nr:hypothetical protein [Candidatus Alkanophaga liquidiphilum]
MRLDLERVELRINTGEDRKWILSENLYSEEIS